MGVIHFDHPCFLKQFKKLILVLNFFRFYRTKDIAYCSIYFGETGANMLYSRAVNTMSSHLPNVFTVILEVGGVFVSLTQKS